MSSNRLIFILQKENCDLYARNRIKERFFDEFVIYFIGAQIQIYSKKKKN